MGGGRNCRCRRPVHAEGTLLSGGGMLSLKILKSRAPFSCNLRRILCTNLNDLIEPCIVPLFQDFKHLHHCICHLSPIRQITELNLCRPIGKTREIQNIYSINRSAITIAGCQVPTLSSFFLFFLTKSYFSCFSTHFSYVFLLFDMA